MCCGKEALWEGAAEEVRGDKEGLVARADRVVVATMCLQQWTDGTTKSARFAWSIAGRANKC